jgi:hypothetical protein
MSDRTSRNTGSTGAACCRGSRLRGWCSPVEVRFVTEGKNSTRVELEHRHLDLYGARHDEMRGIFDSDMGWKGLLDGFAARASAQQGGSSP